MIRQNLHTHTVYDDGAGTPMEMAAAAVSAGLTGLGFSGHSVLPYENDWAMTERSREEWLAKVRETKSAMSGRLEVFTGLEWDLLSAPPEGYDYVIGSIHHLGPAAPYLTVDESPEVTLRAITEVFGGDRDALAEAWFAQYETLARCGFVDIVGHFDLLTKFDEQPGIFDALSRRFREAAMDALELLCRADKIFEVNTGAIARGRRSVPYPSGELLRELKARGARVLVTSDAHSADAVACAFPQTEALLRETGFRELWELTGRGFVPVLI